VLSLTGISNTRRIVIGVDGRIKVIVWMLSLGRITDILIYL